MRLLLREKHPVSPSNRARYFVHRSFDGLECLTARFRSHRYAMHAHETYVVGAIGHGCGAVFIRGTRQLAAAGDLTLYNPGEVHDGAPGDEAGFGYRVTYPATGTLRRIAMEVAGRTLAQAPSFKAPMVRDASASSALLQAHRALEAGEEGLATDQALLATYATILVRHAQVAPAAMGRDPGPVARVSELIAERYADKLSLAELAAEAGLSRFHLLRAFRRSTGLTPHDYLVNRRIEIAKGRLRAGDSAASVALGTGFADQAHFTRAFRRCVGVAPGAYRVAMAA